MSTVAPATSKPLTDRRQSTLMLVTLWLFVSIPFLALAAAVPVAWGWGISLPILLLTVVFYVVGCAGIGVGFHRLLTHRAFKAKRWLRIALTVAGSLAIEGLPSQWVADHRRHHHHSDDEGDPHSPWRYGESARGLVKARGFAFAHVFWLFRRGLTDRTIYTPDLLKDRDIQRLDRLFPFIVTFSLMAPAVLGGLFTWSWQGAITGFFWAGLVRIALMHHVTWSINSVCHIKGERRYRTSGKDRSVNVWWLALLSMGESWHNTHHADPTCARHGVDRGQLDANARIIWIFEKLGWAWDVKWPNRKRLAAKQI
jgi:stearoyl-CoA desaturase (Delta-9 desaturase)